MHLISLYYPEEPENYYSSDIYLEPIEARSLHVNTQKVDNTLIKPVKKLRIQSLFQTSQFQQNPLDLKGQNTSGTNVLQVGQMDAVKLSNAKSGSRLKLRKPQNTTKISKEMALTKTAISCIPSKNQRVNITNIPKPPNTILSSIPSSQNQRVNITRIPKPPNTILSSIPTCSSQNQRVNITRIPKPSNTVWSSTTVQANANSNNNQMLACKECDTLYATKGGLSKHMKKIHGKENGNIDCSHCNGKFATIKSLIDHLIQSHNMNINVKRFHFKSYDLFLSFKIQAELVCNANYVQQCGKNISTDGSTERCYYYCNRSGKFESKSQNKRQIKIQGSSKIGTQCTAHMKVTHNKLTNEVDVEYCDYHHIHDVQVVHLRIPEETRMTIASQLQQGVTIGKIMDNIRDKIHSTVSRELLVTRLDVLNIRRQYNIECIEKAKSDLLSVTAWVKELEELEYNPITIFKVQGEEQGENMDNVAQNDFVLGVQTKFQRDLMIKFIEKGICIDTTHKTNQYDFQLLTLLVVDDFGEGVPVGWMISNREDGLVIIEFLKSIQARVDQKMLRPQFFMSDDAEQFFNAWRGVFGTSNTKKLLCSWHVDRAWRKSLHELVPTQSERVTIYHHLRTLLQCDTILHFRILLQNFLSWLIENEHNDFCMYFQTTYCKRVEEWAFSFRDGTPFNTNMFVESFHRVLKVVYLENKQNRRIDRLLNTLLRIARYKAYERLIKVEKGKTTHRMCEINKRHQTAITLMEDPMYQPPTEQLHEDGTIFWNVLGSEMHGKEYRVTKVKDKCDCKVLCKPCNTCTHLFKCTCIDSLVHSTVCKHIHIVQMTKENKSPETKVEELDGNGILFDNEYFLQVLGKEKMTTKQDDLKLSDEKMKMAQLIRDLQSLNMQCTSIDAVTISMTHVRTAISVIKALQVNRNPQLSIIPRKRVAPNANNEKQLRFHSTIKKRKIVSRWAKPTEAEVEECRENLMDIEVKVCGICYKEDDSSTCSQVHWMQCGSCFLWVHEHCISRVQSNDSGYKCGYCSGTAY